MPSIAAEARLAAARDLLKRLSEGRRDIDETILDRMITEAEAAFAKLQADGEAAELSAYEVSCVEAVIEADGSRPVLFVRNNAIDIDAPEITGELGLTWREPAIRAAAGIGRVAAAVGAVQLPAFDNRRFGTVFAIAPGLVVTNRHVLEEVAVFEDGVWRMTRDAEVDFVGEHERPGENRFKIAGVVLTGPDVINRRINFAHLDLAVLKVEGNLARFPAPVHFSTDLTKLRVGQTQPAIYAMGFPARPLVAPGQSGESPPTPGSEFQDVLDKLYANRFGSKRWSPGFVDAGPGQLAGDARRWVFSHDASTLGGNSGSCIVDLSDGEQVVGLHFGGKPRRENYAHAVAALQEELKSIERMKWV